MHYSSHGCFYLTHGVQHRLHILQQEYMENSNMRIISWKQAYQCQSHISRYQ